jgi:hypothetical protein
MKEEEIKYNIIKILCKKKDGKEGLLKLLDDAVCFVSVNMEEE